MEAINDIAVVRAYATAIDGAVHDFLTAHGRAPVVLNVGLRGGSHAAACLAAGAAEVVLVSLDPDEIALASRYLSAADAESSRWSVLRRSPMQLVANDRQYDVLVLDAFGPLLNNHNAAVTARALWTRGVVRTFDGGSRYVVPLEAAATVRLCVSPDLAARTAHTVAATGATLTSSPERTLKWAAAPRSANLTPASPRIEVLREQYDTHTLTAVEWPSHIAVPGPWLPGSVLLYEWALLMRDGMPPVTTTLSELSRLAPVTRAAREAVWGHRVCTVCPGEPHPFAVTCRPGQGVGLAASAPSATIKTRQLPETRHRRIADAEFARAVHINNTAADI